MTNGLPTIKCRKDLMTLKEKSGSLIKRCEFCVNGYPYITLPINGYIGGARR